MGFGLYVLPAQTVHDGNPLGIWFQDILVHVQVDIENVFGDVLASLLRYKSTGLILDPALSQIVHQHDNGYDAIYDLLVHASHPFLKAYPLIPTEPCQHLDCKLLDYCWGGMCTICIKRYMASTCQIVISCKSFSRICLPHTFQSQPSVHEDPCTRSTLGS